MTDEILDLIVPPLQSDVGLGRDDDGTRGRKWAFGIDSDGDVAGFWFSWKC